MLGPSLVILMTTYIHLARYARDIPGTQDETAQLRRHVTYL